jgi:hypothetical protein
MVYGPYPEIRPVDSLSAAYKSAQVAQASVGVFTQQPSMIPVPLPL